MKKILEREYNADGYLCELITYAPNGTVVHRQEV